MKTEFVAFVDNKRLRFITIYKFQTNYIKIRIYYINYTRKKLIRTTIDFEMNTHRQFSFCDLKLSDYRSYTADNTIKRSNYYLNILYKNITSHFPIRVEHFVYRYLVIAM